MYRRRRQQLFIIIALVVGIASLSIGYAAFSATLNISSSASVTPSASDFSLRFSGSEDDPYDTEIESYNSDVASTARIVGNSITGMNLNFSSKSEAAGYTFYIHNTGMYPAYLKSIDFGDGKVCEAVGDASEDLVQAACNDVMISDFSVGNNDVYLYMIDGGKYEYGGHKLDPGEVELVSLSFYYAPSTLADGEFIVKFDDIIFDYSTVDSDEITFTILGKTYTAKENMLWCDWIVSEYNIDGLEIDPHNMVVSKVEKRCWDIMVHDTIKKDFNYDTLESNNMWCGLD